MINFNLLPHRERLRMMQRDEFNKSIVLAMILAGVTAFAIYGSLNASLEAQRQNKETLEKEIKHFEAQIVEIKDLEKQISMLLARQKAVEDIQSDRNSPVRLLSEVAKNTPQGVVLTKLGQKDQEVTIEGIAKSNESLSEFLDNLGQTDSWFSKPELQVSSAETVTTPSKAQLSAYKFIIKVMFLRSQESVAPMGAASAPSPAASAAPKA